MPLVGATAYFLSLPDSSVAAILSDFRVAGGNPVRMANPMRGSQLAEIR